MKRTVPVSGGEKLSDQMKRKRLAPSKDPAGAIFVSTGSTLLDLAISGGRVRGGGIPGGILVEIFGPSSAGKTVMLCELAGAVQRLGGEIMFRDPEARLNRQFAQIFGFDVEQVDYETPNTVTEAFASLYDWDPKGKGKIHGYFTDSLAALSTDMELEKEEGDKMGMRRAKEFSQELRKIARILPERNILMVCSNQVRMNPDAGPYGQKYRTPGGVAVEFYSSLRLQCRSPQKLKKIRKVRGEKVTRVIGVETEIEIVKSSIWKPRNTATVTILFDYGIDDVRQNLQFIKTMTKSSIYKVGGTSLGNSLDDAIETVESDKLTKDLREEVIDLWEEIEREFKSERTRTRDRS